MNLSLSFAIQLAGILQFVIAVANFFAPAKLHYRDNLAKISPIIRQIFIVHSIYIVLVLIGFGLICLMYPIELCTSPLGKFICRSLAIFWGLRVILQFAYYDRKVKEENPLGTLCFGTAFLLLATVFIGATFLAI